MRQQTNNLDQEFLVSDQQSRNQNWVCGLVLLSLSLYIYIYRSSCFLFVSQFLLGLLFVHLETIWLYSSRLVFHSYLPSNAMILNGTPNTAFGQFNQQHVEFQTISCSFQQSGPTKTGISDQQKNIIIEYHPIYAQIRNINKNRDFWTRSFFFWFRSLSDLCDALTDRIVDSPWRPSQAKEILFLREILNTCLGTRWQCVRCRSEVSWWAGQVKLGDLTFKQQLVGGDWNHGLLWLSHHLGNGKSSQLTKSIIFQRGWWFNHQPEQRWGWIIQQTCGFHHDFWPVKPRIYPVIGGWSRCLVEKTATETWVIFKQETDGLNMTSPMKMGCNHNLWGTVMVI